MNQEISPPEPHPQNYIQATLTADTSMNSKITLEHFVLHGGGGGEIFSHDFKLKFNPFTATSPLPGRQVHTQTPPNSIFDGPVTNLLSMLCILTEILSCAHAKWAKKTEWFQIWHFYWSFSQ